MSYTEERIENKLDNLLEKINQLIIDVNDIKYITEIQSDKIQEINNELSNVRNDTSNILSNMQ